MRKIVASRSTSMDGVAETAGRWPFPCSGAEMGAVVESLPCDNQLRGSRQ